MLLVLPFIVSPPVVLVLCKFGLHKVVEVDKDVEPQNVECEIFMFFGISWLGRNTVRCCGIASCPENGSGLC